MSEAEPGGMVATKLYGWDWWPRTAIEPGQLALQGLRDAGTTTIIAQNRIDPLPGSDVDQASVDDVPSDLDLRRLLHGAGLRIFEASSIFFQPEVLRTHSDLRPVDANGEYQRPRGWYAGLCPSSEEYLREKGALVRRVVSELSPDGIFLSFIRYPGFWEMWPAEVVRRDVPEFCFCERCLRRFSLHSGIALPDDTRTAAKVLQGELRSEWTDWKCQIITEAARYLRDVATAVNPKIEVMVSLVPFTTDGRDGLLADVLGQRVEELGTVADYLEIMAYHQILKEEPEQWLAELVGDICARTHIAVVPTLQVSPTYLTPPYAAAKRRGTIGVQEFRAAVEAVAASRAAGIATYYWGDLLREDATTAGAYSRALREFRRDQSSAT